MNNIIDYLQWRKDLTLDQDPFNEIDSLILSRAAYLRWEYIFEGEEQYTFQQAYQKLQSKGLDNEKLLADEDPQLFLLLSQSQRFQSCIISDFISEHQEEQELQFCALLFHLDDKTHYVAFRGTDNTLIGWKENLNMCFQDVVGAQRQALRYLRKAANEHKGRLRLGGHSKGGNLAVYSALFTLKSIQKRILSVDNFDGPGLSRKMYEKRKDHAIYQKVHSYYPQNSIVGRFLYQKEFDYTLIQSSKKGIYQHDLYSWQLLGKEFICAEAFDRQSEIIENAINDFLEKISPSQRRECVDVIFEVLSSTNEETFHDLSNNWLKNTSVMIKSISKVDSAERKVILDSIKAFLNAVFDELKEADDK